MPLAGVHDRLGYMTLIVVQITDLTLNESI